MKICQRTPCDPFVAQLGKSIFGTEKGAYELNFLTAEGQLLRMPLIYCFFCGTRTSEIDEVFLKQRVVRERHKKPAEAVLEPVTRDTTLEDLPTPTCSETAELRTLPE